MDVGPVIQSGALGQAVVDSILALNHDARVVDRGAYLRVSVPGRCVLTREAVEQRTGAEFRLPADLEIVMSSFQGRMKIDEQAAEWLDPGGDR